MHVQRIRVSTHALIGIFENVLSHPQQFAFPYKVLQTHTCTSDMRLKDFDSETTTVSAFGAIRQQERTRECQPAFVPSSRQFSLGDFNDDDEAHEQRRLQIATSNSTSVLVEFSLL